MFPMSLIMGLSFLFGCYLGASVVLFKCPKLLHKRKCLKFKCHHISHRGGAGENYENTMTAFRSAVNIGTDMLEIDCHLTHDGQVVVVHDADLKGRTGFEGKILDKQYCDLPLLKETLSIDFVPGAFFTGNSDDRRIPLLQDVFEAFPSTPINIDIKEDNDLLISKNPDICLLFSVRRTIILLALLYTGLLPFVPLKETHLEIFIPSHTFKIFRFGNSLAWWQTFLTKMADILLIRKCLFNHLSKRGIQTYLWVMNTEEEYRLAFESGATGVMTDYPTRLKQFLDSNPKYKE